MQLSFVLFQPDVNVFFIYFILFFFCQNWRWVDCISRVSLVEIVHMKMLFSYDYICIY